MGSVSNFFHFFYGAQSFAITLVQKLPHFILDDSF